MRKTWIVVTALLAVGGLIAFRHAGPAPHPPGTKGADKNQAVPVQVAVAHYGTLELVLEELGTVTSRHTVTVTPRVDDQIQHVLFHEGQMVKAGQVLEQLDPRPFQVVVDQWSGQLLHDQALLDDARLDLARYETLLAKDSIGSQQVDTQKALVKQYEGTVVSDRAQLANARLQLGFCEVTAPVSGRVGLRLVDAGNMVHAAQTTGMVLITQMQPIDVVFAIPQNKIGAVVQAGPNLAVDVYDQNDEQKLASGRLLAIDNQVNTTTGTVNLKASFANQDNRLFPNEFVNVHLQAGSLHHVILVPIAAVQTGAKGAYVYVMDSDHQARLRQITQGPVSGETASVMSGLSDGDVVVTDGVDRLHDGSKIVGSGNPANGLHAGGNAHHRRHPGDNGVAGKAAQ